MASVVSDPECQHCDTSRDSILPLSQDRSQASCHCHCRRKHPATVAGRILCHYRMRHSLRTTSLASILPLYILPPATVIWHCGRCVPGRCVTVIWHCGRCVGDPLPLSYNASGTTRPTRHSHRTRSDLELRVRSGVLLRSGPALLHGLCRCGLFLRRGPRMRWRRGREVSKTDHLTAHPNTSSGFGFGLRKI